MSDQFLGEIRIFAGNFAPLGWALCQGQTLPINSYTALFSLLGTNYGGNGTSNFKLPDFQGRAALAAGGGPGLTYQYLGQALGTETVQLQAGQIPGHVHALQGDTAAANASSPAGAALASARELDQGLPVSAYQGGGPSVALAAASIGPNVTPNVPLNLMQPSLALNFIIATTGIYPSRS